MRKFIAVITNKAGNDIGANIVIFSDDSSKLEDVTSSFEKQRDYRVGESNRFGSVLKEIVEVDCLDSILILDDFQPY